jgi:hypothetical protein
LFVGGDDASHFVHGVDDLCGFVTHSGGILPDVLCCIIWAWHADVP